MKLSRYALKHPEVIGMLLIVLISFGFISLNGLNMSFMGDLSLPSIAAVSIYPGASAQDIERDITDILENEFATLNGLKKISSSSKDSLSIITLFFQDGIDPYEQLPEVRNRINGKLKDLPENIQGIPDAVVGGAEMLPVITFSVSGGENTEQLTDYIENVLKPRLTSVTGVSQVYVTGGKKLQLRIKLRTDDLKAKNIAIAHIYNALRYANIKLPAGSAEYETQTMDIRYDASFQNLADIENVSVGASSGDNKVIIKLKDIADIGFDYRKSEIKVSDGEKALIMVDVKKRSDANVMHIAKAVKKILDQSHSDTNGAIEYTIINDDSRVVKASISTVIISGISGIIMAVAVLFLFLNDAKATLIVGISIPLSILFTFIGMKIFHISINLMSLSGMVTALGMVVDASIVMIEQVYRYYKLIPANKDGNISVADLEKAVSTGSDEVGQAILSGAATTIVVFLPIALLSGLVGMMLKDIAITLILALSASLFTALIVVPFLMRCILVKKNIQTKNISLFNKQIAVLEKRYERALRKTLHMPKTVIALSVAVLLCTFFLIRFLGITFIPVIDNSDYYAALHFPAGYSLEQTHTQMINAKRILQKNIPEIQNTILYSGASDNFISSRGTPNEAFAHIILRPVAKRKRTIQSVIIETQRLLASSLPDVQVSVTNGGFNRLLGYVAGGGGFGISLQGENMEDLYAESLRISRFLKEDPEILSVKTDTAFDAATLVLAMNHDYMNELGINGYEAGISSMVLFRGTDIGRFTDKTSGKRYDIHLVADTADKPLNEDSLTDIEVKSRTGQTLSFASLVNQTVEQNFSSINHTNRTKSITVSAVPIGDDTSRISKRLQTYLNNHPLKAGIRSTTSGITELLEDSVPRMIQALLIACFLVYTVMVLQFERFRQPLLIMGAIPFSLIGVVFSLLLFGSTVSLIAFLGLISLAGIVVNNAIILIDHINSIRKKESEQNAEDTESLITAIAGACASRLRPILMTTLTTMLGVLPLAFARGEGAESYTALGQAIAGGLLTSTLISLFLIPVLYRITESPRTKKQNDKKDTTARKRSLKRSGGLFIFTLFITASHIQVYAQHTMQNEKRLYTYEDLADAALKNNPLLRKAVEEVLQSTYDVKDAKALLQPHINTIFSASYLYNNPLADVYVDMRTLVPPHIASSMPTGNTKILDFPDNDFRLSLTLNQPIFLWQKGIKTVSLYSAMERIKHIRFQDGLKKTQTEIKIRLCTLYYLRAMAELCAEQKQYTAELSKAAELAVQKGGMLEQDAAKIRLNVHKAETVEAEIRHAMFSAVSELQNISSVENLTVDNLVLMPYPETADFLKKSNIDSATRQNLEQKALANADGAASAALFAVNAAKIADTVSTLNLYGIPDIVFSGKIEYGGSVDSFQNDGFFDKNKLKVGLSLGIQSILWDGGKKLTDKKRSQSRQNIAQADLDEAILSIKKAVNARLNTVELCNIHIAYLADQEAVAEELLQQHIRLFNSGSGSETEVLQSRANKAAVKIQVLEQKLTRDTAFYTLEYLCDSRLY